MEEWIKSEEGDRCQEAWSAYYASIGWRGLADTDEERASTNVFVESQQRAFSERTGLPFPSKREDH
jgi:hypothetical protein